MSYATATHQESARHSKVTSIPEQPTQIGSCEDIFVSLRLSGSTTYIGVFTKVLKI